MQFLGKSFLYSAVVNILCVFAAQAYTLDFANSDQQCLIPFTKQKFRVEDAYNDFDGGNPAHLHALDAKEAVGSYTVEDRYRWRYLVGDFNTMFRGPGGVKTCRGLTEVYPKDIDIHELADPAVKAHYALRVKQFHTPPIARPPTELGGCIGQTIAVCEMVRMSDGSLLAKKIARFAASSRDSSKPKDYPQLTYIRQRGWSKWWEDYTRADELRDDAMGGSMATKKLGGFYWYHALHLNAFMHFDGDSAPRGIHDIAPHADERSNLVYNLGSPVALGCIYTSTYAANFIRWYIPRRARFFIHYERDLYEANAPAGSP